MLSVENLLLKLIYYIVNETKNSIVDKKRKVCFCSLPTSELTDSL